MLESWITRFRKNTFPNTLLLGVILFHFIFLVMILFLSPDSFRKKERKHLIVRTVTPQPQPKIAAVQKAAPRASPAPKAMPAPKKLPDAPKPEVKKQIAAAPPQKKPVAAKEPAIAEKKLAPAKQPAPQKKIPPPPPARANISDSLLKELEESIAKIENKSDKTAISKKTSTPSRAAIPMTLQIDRSAESDKNSEQQSYTDTLISHLHQSLSLPDYGEVKIQLSLRQDGTVAKVIVLKAKNEKNRQYLESNLTRLQFPRFDGVWANKKEHTFVLTFCNEN